MSNFSIFLMLLTKGSAGLFRESMSTLKAELVTVSMLKGPKNLRSEHSAQTVDHMFVML